jgi:hypothetical protein
MFFRKIILNQLILRRGARDADPVARACDAKGREATLLQVVYYGNTTFAELGQRRGVIFGAAELERRALATCAPLWHTVAERIDAVSAVSGGQALQ